MRRTERLSLVVTLSEKERAQKLAESQGVSVATAIRLLLREAAQRQEVRQWTT